jgi:hypothetical protein
MCVVTESDDLKQFMRDIAARHERIWRDQANVLQQMLAELKDLRQESQAHTRALLRVLDKLQNGGASA